MLVSSDEPFARWQDAVGVGPTAGHAMILIEVKEIEANTVPVAAGMIAGFREEATEANNARFHLIIATVVVGGGTDPLHAMILGPYHSLSQNNSTC